jgi:hypothetical protein
MKRQSTFFAAALCAVLAASAFSLPGDQRFKVKGGKIDQLKSGKKLAIVSFQANTVITGSSGVGSLVSGAMAGKGSGEKPTLDQKFVDDTYDLYAGLFAGEGYELLSPEQVKASPAYQAAAPVKLPTMLDAKGLKGVNFKKAEEFKRIASELGADRLMFFTSGHGLSSRISMLGDLAGKVNGQATLMVVCYDADGKKLFHIDAAEISDTQNQQVAGGFQDPKKILPMFREADQKLAANFAAHIAKK